MIISNEYSIKIPHKIDLVYASEHTTKETVVLNSLSLRFFFAESCSLTVVDDRS